MKRTIEIEDTLQERVDSAIDDVKQELLNFLEANPDFDGVPCINNDLDYSGAIHEIIDGSVPIYTHEINSTMFLHGSEIEQAFDDAGLGTRDDFKDSPLGWQGAAIYCYIQEQVNDWYHNNAEDVVDEWREAHPVEA